MGSMEDGRLSQVRAAAVDALAAVIAASQNASLLPVWPLHCWVHLEIWQHCESTSIACANAPPNLGLGSMLRIHMLHERCLIHERLASC